MPVVDRNACNRVLEACVKVLTRAGCSVTSDTINDSLVSLTIELPAPDSDIHNLRLLDARQGAPE